MDIEVYALNVLHDADGCWETVVTIGLFKTLKKAQEARQNVLNTNGEVDRLVYNYNFTDENQLMDELFINKVLLNGPLTEIKNWERCPRK